MDKYMVIKEETHPDRCIDETYGPFDSYSEADTFAEMMEKRPENYNHGHRLYSFRPYTLTRPENA